MNEPRKRQADEQGHFPKVGPDDTFDDGDMTLFNGFLRAAGEDLACDALRAPLDSTGQWWRSPRRVGGQFE